MEKNSWNLLTEQYGKRVGKIKREEIIFKKERGMVGISYHKPKNCICGVWESPLYKPVVLHGSLQI